MKLFVRRHPRLALALIALIGLGVLAGLIVHAEHERKARERRQEHAHELRAARESRKRSQREAEREREAETRRHDEAIEAAERERPSTAATGPGFLGVQVENMTAGTELGTLAFSEHEAGCHVPDAGALIVRVEPGGPAANVGLHGATHTLLGYEVGGDLIIGLEREPIPDTDVLLADLAQHKAGEAVSLEVIECSGRHAIHEVTLSPTDHMPEEEAAAKAAERNAEKAENRKAEAEEQTRERKEEREDEQWSGECKAHPKRPNCGTPEERAEEERQRESESPQHQQKENQEYEQWQKGCEGHPERQGCGGE